LHLSSIVPPISFQLYCHHLHLHFFPTRRSSDLISILINNKLPLSVGEVILFFNFFIFSTAGFVFSWERAMYSILTYFIASKFIDIIVSGLNESKSAWIISDNPEKIADAILARLGRSVTVLNGLNPYSGEE